MNVEETVGTTICIILGLLFFLISWLIWKKKKLWLIAGYQDDTFTGDRNKLAKDMGILSIIIGICVIIMPFSLMWIGKWTGLVITGVILFFTFFYLIKVNLNNG